ncbi:MATE family efflux transporter [Bifidobacterium imperatoris]|uniref:Multidrug export protein MepA n=2 Tax=Bifidobacterium imperatoris TaxID=2020965 RepID=A0A2N5ITL2_9BIFI|nr:MATE family efflux transporter [Bifidobacterium imperatoris]PLS25312.1 MATE family efflux transporter [Bifidobacterium imperatoris]QSY57927.1 MATE family efflux transporter [Bifidobacterium imperatoris]
MNQVHGIKRANADAKYHQMTEQPIPSLILTLSVPAVVSNLVTTAYNLTDTFFIGQLGTSQSGAIGIAFSIMTVLQALGFFCGQGAGNSLSRELGKRDIDRASKLLAIGFVAAFSFGLLVAIICLATLRPLVMLLGSTATIAPYAVQYLTPILVAAPCVCGSFALNGLLRYQGQSAYGMIGLVTGSLLNFLLAPLFIFVLDMGIFGAGLATGICQTVSFIILVVMSAKFGVLRLSLRNFKPDPLLLREILGGGLPSLIRQSAGSIATTCVNIAANPFGDAAIAGMAIVMRIMLGVNSVIIGLGQGFQPVCGYNYGAGKFARVREGFWFCVKLSTAVLVVLGALIWVIAPQLVEIFRSDPAVVSVGVAALHFECLSVALNGVNMMGNMISQTLGKTGIASFLAVCRTGLYLAPVVLILPQFMGVTGVEVAQTVSDVLTFITTVPFMRYILHKFLAQNRV